MALTIFFSLFWHCYIMSISYCVDTLPVSKLFHTCMAMLPTFDSEDDYRTGCRNVSHCQ